MKSALGSELKFLRRNRYEKIEKAMVKRRVKIARIRLVELSDEVKPPELTLKEVHIDRQTMKKVCIRARRSELNMSLPRANLATFWMHKQHLGKM